MSGLPALLSVACFLLAPELVRQWGMLQPRTTFLPLLLKTHPEKQRWSHTLRPITEENRDISFLTLSITTTGSALYPLPTPITCCWRHFSTKASMRTKKSFSLSKVLFLLQKTNATIPLELPPLSVCCIISSAVRCLALASEERRVNKQTVI